jgi:hypothetical protein
MVKPLQIAIVLIALNTHAAWTQAQTVYRCGESYSNEPCPGGKVVSTDDARSPAQRAQSDALTQRDARSAQAMERERLKQEGKPAHADIAPAQPASAEQAVRPAAKHNMRKPEVFKAVAPRKAGEPAARKTKKKRKARQP